MKYFFYYGLVLGLLMFKILPPPSLSAGCLRDYVAYLALSTVGISIGIFIYHLVWGLGK